MNYIRTPAGTIPVDEPVREITQEQYDALSEEEKSNGTTYYITDGQSSGSGGNANMRILTQEEYDQLSTEEKNNGTVYYVNDDAESSTISASLISYNNTNSGLSAVTTQGAIDELNSNLTNTNNSLDTIKIKTSYFTGINTDANGVYQTSLNINSRKILSARCNVVNAIVIPYYNNGTQLCFVVVNANGYTPYKNLSNIDLAYEYIETI